MEHGGLHGWGEEGEGRTERVATNVERLGPATYVFCSEICNSACWNVTRFSKKHLQYTVHLWVWWGRGEGVCIVWGAWNTPKVFERFSRVYGQKFWRIPVSGRWGVAEERQGAPCNTELYLGTTQDENFVLRGTGILVNINHINLPFPKFYNANEIL